MNTAQFSSKHLDATGTIDQLPAALDSSNWKLIYLYLTITEEATITDLQSTLQMKQLALYYFLS